MINYLIVLNITQYAVNNLLTLYKIFDDPFFQLGIKTFELTENNYLYLYNSNKVHIDENISINITN